MKKILGQFKEFALKGNVLDLAVGVIIGASFQGIVKSLVDDIISPIIGLFAKKDFSSLVIQVFNVNIRYGAFMTAVINFLIMVFLIFLLVKAMNKLSNIGKKQAKETDKEVTTKECPFCCTKISVKAARCPNCTSILDEEKV